MTVTDEQLEEKEREVADLMGDFGVGREETPGQPNESKERIERILRRIKLENRIQEEVEAAAKGTGTGTGTPDRDQDHAV